MKIELEYPYSEDWKFGYIVINSERRQTLILYNSHVDRTSTQYSRYLVAVKLGRYLSDKEHVDHIDNDKTNDEVSNLQILTLAENNKKAGRYKGHEMAKLKCPACGVEFIKYKKQTFLIKGGKLTFCSRKCSGLMSSVTSKLNNYELEKAQSENIIEIFRNHT
jgi:hypothetical protein